MLVFTLLLFLICLVSKILIVSNTSMSKFKRTKEKVNNFLYDHYYLKQTLHQTKGLFFAVVSAFVFAFGFTAFVTPGSNSDFAFKIVTGGISGLSQNVAKIASMCGIHLEDRFIEAMGYTVFNLPLLIFAFFKVGKRFSILSAINVILSSVFISMLPEWGISQEIANHALILNHPVSRLLFAGACTGIASGLAFKGEISCGGIDIVTYYFSLRKSTSVGKYSIIVNGSIVALYSLLIIIDDPANYETAIISLFYSAFYILVANLVIDSINLRNKKIQIQFITKNMNLSKALMSHFPHGATIQKAEGAYTHSEEQIIWMVVSSFELKTAVALARKVDPHVFISVTSLIQVYGNFYIRPVE